MSESKLAKWSRKNPYVLHWTVVGGEVWVISLFAKMEDRKQAQALARALRYRKVKTASSSWSRVSASQFSFGVLQAALKAIKVDWQDFDEQISKLYFNASAGKHIPDRVIKP